ncbi:hypothetical protein V5O48_012107 [Marasmius crinis-equi]|uniref:SAP domain-containing protein n=1 Tax=Marasmius crinis-equi TaxID=585013 RepID=A0ABR3F4A6_9AGAR
MERKNVGKHVKGAKHQNKLSTYLRTRVLKATLGLDQGSTATSTDVFPTETHSGGESDRDVPISELWTLVSREITIPELEGEAGSEPADGDYYRDYARSLESDNIISVQLPLQRALGSSEELPDDNGEEEDELDEPNTRMRYSESQKIAVLEWGKSLGARDVPSLHALKKVQRSIDNMVRSPTEKVVSSSGTVFYINEISQAIAKDFSNPITRLSMSEYPEDGGSSASELKHGSKWLLELPRDLLTITARVDNKIYFVGELLQCRASGGKLGGFFIPDRFFTRTAHTAEECVSRTDLFALGYVVNRTVNGFAVSGSKIVIPTETFRRNFEDLKEDGILDCGFANCSKSYEAHMPHSRREKAKGRMVYGVPLIIFLDDVSANISKQWNKHHAIYMSNGLLPRQMIEKEFSTRFVTSSPHATPMELVKGLKDSIARAAEDGVETYDCKHDEECLLVPHAHFWGSDNPMQAEECSHGGLKCNFFCRMCKVGGTQEQKRSDEGFLSLFEAGEERTPENTSKLIHEQLHLSALHGATDKLQKHKAATGVSDSTSASAVQAIVDLGKALYGGKHPDSAGMSKEDIKARLDREVERVVEVHGINPVIGMPGVDIHKDTPTEILHTILLGAVKYFWGQTVYILEKNKSFATFQTRLASVDESGLNIPRLSAEYICGYKGSLIGKHFKSLAQLMPFLIYDLVPRKVLDAWSIIGELVVLVWHTQIDDLEEYLDITKHIVTGGYWRDPTSRKWVRAGDTVLYHMQESKVFRKLLAIPDNSGGNVRAGSVKLVAGGDTSVPAVGWQATKASSASNGDSFCHRRFSSKDDQFFSALAFRAVNGDQVQLNGFVAFCIGEQFRVGRAKEILTTSKEPSKAVAVALEVLEFLNDPHELLRMPVLQPSNTTHLQVADPSGIICALNVQHDCYSGNCTTSKSRVVYQERQETSRSRAIVDHADIQRFILNTHSLHNHLTISKLLPSFLTSVLSRPPLSSNEQEELRLRAASHVRSQKLADGDDGPAYDLEVLPFEAGSRGGRGGGRGGRGGRGGGRGGRLLQHQGPNTLSRSDNDLDPGISAMRSQLESLKKDQLVDRCREQHLPVSGTKPVLIERLMGAAQGALPRIAEPGLDTTEQSEQQHLVGSVDDQAINSGLDMNGMEAIQVEAERNLDENCTEWHPENVDHEGDHIMQPIADPTQVQQTPLNLDTLKRAQLVELCLLNSLAKSGNKPELIARLRSKEVAQGWLTLAQ